MERFLRHFKLPLIVTGIAMVVVTIVGIVIVTSITRSGGPRPEERAAMLGQGLGIFTTIVIAPFWIYAVMQFGNERRAELKKISTKPKSGPTKKRSKNV